MDSPTVVVISERLYRGSMVSAPTGLAITVAPGIASCGQSALPPSPYPGYKPFPAADPPCKQ